MVFVVSVGVQQTDLCIRGLRSVYFNRVLGLLVIERTQRNARNSKYECKYGVGIHSLKFRRGCLFKIHSGMNQK